MSEKRELNIKNNIKVVTANTFITACGLDKVSLKSRKLLYLAIAQCRKTDTGFYEYSISIPVFTELMGIDSSNVYEEADKITDELMKGFIRADLGKGEGFRKYQLFDMCEYIKSKGYIRFEISKKMTDFLLKLQGDFTQPLLYDFVKMNSPYSMAIWHLMQKKMKSKKPGITDIIKFDLSLAELREVTGTQETFSRLSDLKRYVLDKALKEIDDNCGVSITYTNIKESRTVTGFRFTAISPFHVDENEIPQEKKDNVRRFQLKQEAKTRQLTPAEAEEYDRLTMNSEQMDIWDLE